MIFILRFDLEIFKDLHKINILILYIYIYNIIVYYISF